MAIQSAKGTYDVLPNEVNKWHYLEKVIHETCSLYNYQEIRTPIFESTDLFIRGVGESTDIVSKEMYTFLDKGDRSITLRPEGTAGVVRAYVEHKLYAEENSLSKFYYLGPMFRYERMQKGRTRQFSQFGVEAIGCENPSVDAEVIALSVKIFKSLGLKSVKVVLNSLGDTESRTNFREALIQHFEPVINDLCGDCGRRLHQNPLRILDCKADHNHPSMKNAPKMSDYLNEYSKNYFLKVIALLDALHIDYVLDDNLVRGLDYYNHTVFEIIAEIEGFGSQTALGGGGRYNGLVAEVGDVDRPGVGFAFGMDRLILALESEQVKMENHQTLDVYFVSMSEKTDECAFTLVEELRSNGIHCEKDYFNRKVKAQFKQADKSNAKFTVVMGDEEMGNGFVNLKDMETQQQDLIRIKDLNQVVKSRLEEK